MKKFLLAVVGMLLLSTFSANAKTVYFSNSANWEKVFSYAWTPEDAKPFDELTSIEIDGHTLYARELTNQAHIIFLNGQCWDNNDEAQSEGWLVKTAQTADLDATDGAVYDATSDHIADIVGGKYVAVENPTPVQHTNLFIRGTMTGEGWAALSDWEFQPTELENIYKLGPVNMVNGAEFKIANNDWSTQWGTATIEAGKSYTLAAKKNGQGNDPANMKVNGNLSNVTFMFNTETNELNVSENNGTLEIKWWCGWNDNGEAGTWTFGHQFEEQVEGTYKVVFTADESTAENYFAVFQSINEPDFEHGLRYTPIGQKDVEVNENGTYNMQTGTNGAWKLMKNGTWTVVIDPRDQANTTISFDYGDSTGEANILINDRTETGYDSKYYAMEALPDTDDDDYTWSGTIGKNDEVMFSIHGVTYGYDPSIITSISEDDETGNLVIVYPLTDENPQYVRFDFDTNVIYNVNVTAKTVTLTQNDPAPATINITKASGASGIHRMEKIAGTTDGYATIHTITFEAGDCVDFRIGATRYIPVFAEVNVMADDTAVPFTLQEAVDEEAAPEWKGTMGSAVYVRVNDNATGEKTGVVQADVPTGVEAVVADEAPAVYYNLQGVRVNNPENGMFIMVKGNKATKIVK